MKSFHINSESERKPVVEKENGTESYCMYTDSEAIRVFDLVEETLQPTINLLYILLNSSDNNRHIASYLYNNLSIFEKILIHFLYHLPISINTDFTTTVSKYLTIIYELQINYSRRFSL